MDWKVEDQQLEPARHLRAETLVLLRWVAIGGQTLAMLYVYYYLKFPFPIGLCFVAIATSSALNIALRAGSRSSLRLDDTEAAVLLAYDVIQLAALLYLTGGVTNAFAMFLLAPVMISAVSLPRPFTLLLGILMVAAATLLTVEFEPLPWREGDTLYFPVLYRLGVWAALVLSAAFIGLYAGRVSDEARKLANALSATELVLERAQHLTQLDGLAAAAAHELGTPLATITLVASELQKIAPSAAPQMSDDLALLAQEARRCREILRKLQSLKSDEAYVLNRMRISTLIEEAVEPMRDPDVEIVVDKGGDAPEPICLRNPGILYGLGNLVENAVDFARSTVRIEARWTPQLVSVVIEDDGPGFAPKILDRVGDPYVSGSEAERRVKSSPDSGLGLGLFIAKTLLERSGAKLALQNRTFPQRGAIVRLQWRRDDFERRVAAAPSGEPEVAATGFAP